MDQPDFVLVYIFLSHYLMEMEMYAELWLLLPFVVDFLCFLFTLDDNQAQMINETTCRSCSSLLAVFNIS